MKQIVIILVFVTSIHPSLFSQITNGSFENYEEHFDPVYSDTTIKPINWSASFYGAGYELTEESYSGNKAIKIWSWYYGQSSTEFYYGEDLNHNNKWQPNNLSPKRLAFYYKFISPCTAQSSGNKDSSLVQLLFSKYDSILKKRDTLFSITKFLPESKDYKQYQIPVEVPSPFIPDSIQILFRNSIYGSSVEDNCSYLFIDLIKLEYITGVNEFNYAQIRLFPNPTQDIIRLDTPIKMEQVSIIDVSGKEVFSATLNNSNSIDISSLPKGIYFLELDVEGKILRKKIVKE